AGGPASGAGVPCPKGRGGRSSAPARSRSWRGAGRRNIRAYPARRSRPRLSNPASVQQQNPAAGRPWRGFAAIAVANQGDQTPDIFKRNPRQVLQEMGSRWIAADEAGEAAGAGDLTPAAGAQARG